MFKKIDYCFNNVNEVLVTGPLLLKDGILATLWLDHLL